MISRFCYFLVFSLCLSVAAGAQNKNLDQHGSAYGHHIIALALLQVWQPFTAGIGMHYEHILDERSKVSFYLPIALSLKKVTTLDSRNGAVSGRYRPVA